LEVIQEEEEKSAVVDPNIKKMLEIKGKS